MVLGKEGECTHRWLDAYWAAVAVLLGPPPRWVDSLATVWKVTVLGWSCGYLLLDCAGDVYVSGRAGCRGTQRRQSVCG